MIANFSVDFNIKTTDGSHTFCHLAITDHPDMGLSVFDNVLHVQL